MLMLEIPFDQVKSVEDLLTYIQQYVNFDDNLIYTIKIVIGIDQIKNREMLVYIDKMWVESTFDTNKRHYNIIYSKKFGIKYPFNVDSYLYEKMLACIFENIQEVPEDYNINELVPTYQMYVDKSTNEDKLYEIYDRALTEEEILEMYKKI